MSQLFPDYDEDDFDLVPPGTEIAIQDNYVPYIPGDIRPDDEKQNHDQVPEHAAGDSLPAQFLEWLQLLPEFLKLRAPKARYDGRGQEVEDLSMDSGQPQPEPEIEGQVDEEEETFQQMDLEEQEWTKDLAPHERAINYFFDFYEWLSPGKALVDWEAFHQQFWKYWARYRKQVPTRIPLSNLINFNDYIHVTVPFVAHLSVEEAKALKEGDVVDFRHINGWYGPVEVAEASAEHESVRLHTPGWEAKWDVWCHTTRDLHRLAKAKSISKRGVLGPLKGAKTGHYVDLNLAFVGSPQQWVTAQVRMACQYGSGQRELCYTEPRTLEKRALWVHLDHDAEVQPHGARTARMKGVLYAQGDEQPLSEQLFEWFVSRQFGLERYLGAFRKQGVYDVESLPFVTEEFLLRDICMTNHVHRRKLLDKIETLKQDSDRFWAFFAEQKEPPLGAVVATLRQQGLVSWELLAQVVGSEKDLVDLVGIQNRRIVRCLMWNLHRYRNENVFPEANTGPSMREEEVEAGAAEEAQPPVAVALGAAVGVAAVPHQEAPQEVARKAAVEEELHASAPEADESGLEGNVAEVPFYPDIEGNPVTFQ